MRTKKAKSPQGKAQVEDKNEGKNSDWDAAQQRAWNLSKQRTSVSPMQWQQEINNLTLLEPQITNPSMHHCISNRATNSKSINAGAMHVENKSIYRHRQPSSERATIDRDRAGRRALAEGDRRGGGGCRQLRAPPYERQPGAPHPSSTAECAPAVSKQSAVMTGWLGGNRP